MVPPRIVSVFGATGLQGLITSLLCGHVLMRFSGGAIVDAILKHGTFVPRAISRDPESEASQKLQARGVQVVKGDALDKTGLINALHGSEAVFAVTVPAFPSVEGKNELAQGKNIVDAAKEVGVKFFIWSCLPSISKLSNGKYKNVTHYEEKDAVREYLESSGLTHASILLPAFLENLNSRPLLKQTEKGYNIAMPIFKAMDRQAWAWISRDVPAAVLALLNNYTNPEKQINGKTYPIVNANISCSELAEITGKALGAEVTFTSVPPTGLLARDEMFACQAEYSGLYTATAVPNPDLVALGMKFSTIEEFLESEVKPRFGK
ncbi:NmrA domain-containing protein [Mycena venus]|uniref:NmrA domain-containing protein n=1 Tax=Mycena venus TaxID=2733690 RepID=A0A8H6YQS0_9AGAR|nr:NmrA domain-containing protein [Mycena venus]